MSLLAYSFASGITLIALGAVYLTLLRNTTHFGFNRASLILIFVASLVVPIIGLPSFETPSDTATELGNLTLVTTVSPSARPSIWIKVIGIIRTTYLIGVVIMLARTAANFVFIFYLRLKSRRIKMDTYTVRVHDHKKIPPMSWGNEIYVAESLLGESQSEFEMILAHEEAHRRHFHWVDLLLSNAVLAINWYNPAAWMMQSELIAVHEYEADRSAANHTGDKTNYQLLLIKKTAGSRFQAIADSLNHSSLKKRITMMMKNQSKSSARLRSLALLPAVAVALLVSNSSCVKEAQKEVSESDPTVETQASEPKTEMPTLESSAKTEASEEVATTLPTAEQIPEFEGGNARLYQLLGEKLMYPQEAMDKGIEGRVIIELKVGRDGQIADARVTKGVNEALDEAALDAIKKVKEAGGKFEPGRNADGQAVETVFVLPVSFKLQ